MIDEASSGHSQDVVQADAPAEDPAEDLSSGIGFAVSGVEAGRLRALVDLYFDFVWRSLRRFGVAAADADDGAQRVFWIVSRKLSRIEPGRERAFLVGTAYRVSSEIRRATTRRAESPLGDAEMVDAAPNPEEFADRTQARALLDRVLDEMPSDARSVFVLFELEELSVPEIAVLLSVPMGTVASRLRRGRQLFRDAAARIQSRSAFRGGT